MASNKSKKAGKSQSANGSAKASKKVKAVKSPVAIAAKTAAKKSAQKPTSGTKVAKTGGKNIVPKGAKSVVKNAEPKGGKSKLASAAGKKANPAAKIKDKMKGAGNVGVSKSVAKAAGKAQVAKRTPAAKTSATKKPSLSLVSSSRNRVTSFKDFFTPLDDRILVEPAAPAVKTAGGIFIPDMVQERPNRGQVVAVGRGHRNKKGNLRPLDVQLGDAVLYGQHSGVSLALEGRDVILLREEEILAIVNT